MNLFYNTGCVKTLEIVPPDDKAFSFPLGKKQLIVQLTGHSSGNLLSYWCVDGSRSHFKCCLILLGHLEAMKSNCFKTLNSQRDERCSFSMYQRGGLFLKTEG